MTMIRPQLATFIDVVNYRAHSTPDRNAVRFLANDGSEQDSLTYGELAEKATAIASVLSCETAVGDRVLLLHPPGVDYVASFLGCLLAGVVAVPAYPPNPSHLQRSLPRLRKIVVDAEAAVTLSNAATLEKLKPISFLASEFRRLKWIATDEIQDNQVHWSPPVLRPVDIAFLQYTSGSTSAPKGVMVSHRNLIANCELMRSDLGLTEDSVAVNWLPPYHDMGLIGAILCPLYTGFSAVLMAPASFLFRPLTWLEAATRYRATLVGAPNFAYELCVRKISPDDRRFLDLSSLAIAVSAAEPVRAETIELFSEGFAPSGFRREAFTPGYGLAESTLTVSFTGLLAGPRILSLDASELQRGRTRYATLQDHAIRLVSAGQPRTGVKIVHPETLSPVDEGDVGEIWVTGPSVAQGYWGKRELTDSVFVTESDGTTDERFLRTGDLGFIRDGHLFCTGRIKDLIIVHGKNHYPQDIEKTVLDAHPALRLGSCAAFAFDQAGTESVGVAVEVERRHQPRFTRPRDEAGTEDAQRDSGPRAAVNPEEVIARIRAAVVAEHEVELSAIMLLRVGGLPKTSSGKLQRFACREGLVHGSLDTLMTWRLDEDQSN